MTGLGGTDPEESPLRRARDLLAKRPVAPGGSADRLTRLCCAVTDHLGLDAAAISVMGASGPDAVVAATDRTARGFVEMQFTAGEGPCLEASREARPVLVPDLDAVDRHRWPGYLSLAAEAGLGAVFSVPLHVGAVRLGVLDVFAHRHVRLEADQVAVLLAFGRLATELLLDDGPAHDAGESWLDSVDYRAEVYQAQGMLMVALDVDLAEALVRLRAHAFAHRRSISELSTEIVEGRIFGEGDI